MVWVDCLSRRWWRWWYLGHIRLLIRSVHSLVISPLVSTSAPLPDVSCIYHCQSTHTLTQSPTASHYPLFTPFHCPLTLSSHHPTRVGVSSHRSHVASSVGGSTCSLPVRALRYPITVLFSPRTVTQWSGGSRATIAALGSPSPACWRPVPLRRFLLLFLLFLPFLHYLPTPPPSSTAPARCAAIS